MPDKSFDGQNNLSSQGESWAELTPDDDADLPFVPKSVCVSSATGGQFTARGSNGVDALFYGNPGQVIPIRPVRILATGLTAGLTLTGLRS
jgi:hypothetical protein